MISTFDLNDEARDESQRIALSSAERQATFGELHARVEGLARALVQHGFVAGDRLALLLPNQIEYIELLCACAWLGRDLGAAEHPLVALRSRFASSSTHDRGGLVRHSSLPDPSVKLEWHWVLDEAPLMAGPSLECKPLCDGEASLCLLYTSGTTGQPKGVVLTHTNLLANLEHVGHWMPLTRDAVYLHAAPIFHIADFPFVFAALSRGARQVTIPKFSAEEFCDAVERERVTHTVLVPTMISILLHFADLDRRDLSCLRVLGYGGAAHGSGADPRDETALARRRAGSGLRPERDGISDRAPGS